MKIFWTCSILLLCRVLEINEQLCKQSVFDTHSVLGPKSSFLCNSRVADPAGFYPDPTV